MFAVEVRDHIMIAHSLQSPFFGPAQGLHGATLSIHATFERAGLDEHGVVMDIGEATGLLDQALAPLRYANLDERPEFEGTYSTTEKVIEHIAETLTSQLPEGHGLRALEVEAEEHPRARAEVRVELV